MKKLGVVLVFVIILTFLLILNLQSPLLSPSSREGILEAVVLDNFEEGVSETKYYLFDLQTHEQIALEKFPNGRDELIGERVIVVGRTLRQGEGKRWVEIYFGADSVGGDCVPGIENGAVELFRREVLVDIFERNYYLPQLKLSGLWMRNDK